MLKTKKKKRKQTKFDNWQFLLAKKRFWDFYFFSCFLAHTQKRILYKKTKKKIKQKIELRFKRITHNVFRSKRLYSSVQQYMHT